MSDKLSGRVPSEPGSREPSPDGLGPSGFDPSRLSAAETQVYLLLRKYRVQKHYRGTAAAKATRYAVFVHGGGQITEPSTNAHATAAAKMLTARDIVTALVPALVEAGHALANALGALIVATDGDQKLRAYRSAGLDTMKQFEALLAACDSDGSPKGGDACGSVHDSAGRSDSKGVAP